MTPAILNGMHMYAYVFIGKIPENVTCVIPSLIDANWSYDDIKQISTRYTNGVMTIYTIPINKQLFREIENKCNIYNWNYTMLSTKSYSEALDYINTTPLPSQIPCKSVDDYYFYYETRDETDSFVPEVLYKIISFK